MTEVLELEIRRRIFTFVLESPALHLREIQRRLGIALGTLRYHLDALEHKGFVSTAREWNRRRYFASGTLTPAERRTISVLRLEGPRTVALHILKNPGATRAELSEMTRLSKTSIRMHIKMLREQGLLLAREADEQGRHVLSDPELVANILRTYRQSFADVLVDRALEIYEEERRSP